MNYKRGYACRCGNSKCRARRTLVKHPDEYVTQPKCRYCGKRKWTVDADRMKRWYKMSRLCRCDGYHFTHRKGSPFCEHNPMGEYNRALRAGYEDEELLVRCVNAKIDMLKPFSRELGHPRHVTS